ncbi:response regulator [Paenibacillus sp. NPDC058174]|uniref:response regulator transcription factor n=1 Tax=Paenibacillus sp. NPDC058174 TaxID=3346366 RepID=UPI0036D9F6C6
MLSILLIDDEPLTTLALRKILENHFPAIEILGEATNGKQAWELIQVKVPDIIISDIRMPHLDGLELLNKVREANLPSKVVLLTAYGEFEYAQKALKLQASGYLLKPYIQSEVIKEIFRLVKEVEAEKGVKESLSKVIPLFEENALKKLLAGKLDSNGLDDFMKITKNRWESCEISVFQLGGTTAKAEEIEEVIKISLTEEVNDYFSHSDCHGISFFHRYNELIVIHASPSGTSCDSALIQGCTQILMNYIEEPFLVGTSSKCCPLLQLADAYAEALSNSSKIQDSSSSRGASIRQGALIEKAVEYCKMNYTTDINLQKIAEYLDVNKNHFCNIFKEQLQVTFWDYVTGLRIAHAKQLLQSSDELVANIAVQSGYINTSHFGRVFKEMVGVTPAEYRRKSKIT